MNSMNLLRARSLKWRKEDLATYSSLEIDGMAVEDGDICVRRTVSKILHHLNLCKFSFKKANWSLRDSPLYILFRCPFTWSLGVATIWWWMFYGKLIQRNERDWRFSLRSRQDTIDGFEYPRYLTPDLSLSISFINFYHCKMDNGWTLDHIRAFFSVTTWAGSDQS